MAGPIDELIVRLGFKYDPKPVRKFKEDLSKVNDELTDLFTKLAAFAAGSSALVVATSAITDEIGKFAAEINDTVDDIDAFSFALVRSGGSADGMRNSLRSLAKAAAEAARGVGSGVEIFGILDIQVMDVNGNLKDTTDLFLEVSKQLKNLDTTQQIDLADKLGLKDSLRLLQQGPEEIAKLAKQAKELGVITEKDAAMAAEFNDSLANFLMVTKDITREISNALIPAMRGVLDSFTEWWVQNQAVIKQRMPEIIESVSKAFRILTVAVGAFVALRLISTVLSAITAMRKLSITVLAVNAAAFLLPTLLAVAIGSLAVLAQDAKVFFEGGDSFIGEMLEKYPEWEKQIKSVANVLNVVWGITTDIFDGWSQIFDLFAKFDPSKIIDDLRVIVSNIPGVLLRSTGALDVYGEGFIGDAAKAVGSGITDALTGADNILSDFGFDPIFGTNNPELITNPAVISGGGAGNTSNSVNVDKVEITVNGSGNPDATAKAVFNIFEQTAQDLNSPVDQ